MSDPSQPTPPAPPVPRYGEYAPEGYVPPQPAPGYEAAAGYQPYGSASYPAQPGARRRKTWDLVLTVVLLVLGAFGALLGVVYGAIFTDPDLLDQALKMQGYGGFSGDPGAAPAVLIVSHIVLYLLALGGSIPLLLTKRVAFWVPLAAGVLAAIIFWATLMGVLLSDPALVSNFS
jgi:hypothetical protein